MSKLPKIKHPIFETELPSDGKKVKFRAFTGKEEKILLMSKESDDIDTILSSTKQVINNCLIDADVDKLPLFDIEYLLIAIRSKSINNIIDLVVTDPETEKKVDIQLNLDEVKLKKDENHNKTIKVDDDTYIEMRYPSWNEFTLYLKSMSENKEESYINLMFSCIDNVYYQDNVIAMKDVSEEERDNFINDLSSSTINEIKNFFETIPVLRHEVEYTNSEGHKKTFVLEGMQTFFI